MFQFARHDNEQIANKHNHERLGLNVQKQMQLFTFELRQICWYDARSPLE